MQDKFSEVAAQVVSYAIERGVSHQTSNKKPFQENKIALGDKNLTNFSICDYLALSNDNRLKEAAIESLRNNGVYTAISRTYLKLNIYQEAEEIVSRIFNKPTLLLPRTTLAHISVFPILIAPTDAVILDHQVHTSVRMASDHVKVKGTYCESLPHNDLTQLEERIIELGRKYDKIWYLVDGVYSMFGDTCPMKELEWLMNKYEQLHVYVDDAHGMSWAGEHGRGYALSQIEYHPRLFLTTSLGKGFGAGGGAIVCPDEATRDRIKMLGAPLMFTSPVEPATLGSIIQSAKIHLSDELGVRQQLLEDNMAYFYAQATAKGLPVVNSEHTPIALMAAVYPDLVIDIANIMFAKGFHLTGGVFPAVPLHNSGLRVVLNLYQSHEDIDQLLDAFVEAYLIELKKRKMTMDEVQSQIKVPA